MAARPSTFFTVGDIRPAEDSDFEHFMELIDGGGWTKKMDKNGLLAWTRSVEDSSIKMFKVILYRLYHGQIGRVPLRDFVNISPQTPKMVVVSCPDTAL